MQKRIEWFANHGHAGPAGEHNQWQDMQDAHEDGLKMQNELNELKKQMNELKKQLASANRVNQALRMQMGRRSR